MKKTIIAVALCSCTILFASCSFLQGILGQAQAIANLANCTYTLTNVNNVSVAGVNLKKITNGQVNAADVITLSAALLQKKLPLSMDVNVNVKNPTNYDARLSTMDWALDIENTQFATGMVNQNRTIAAKKNATVPLAVGTDLYSLFSKGGIESVKKFAGSFKNDGTSSKVALRIRPHVTVAGMDMPTSYITLSKNVGVTPKNK
ncbi:MAG: LEA type 2 family protein [Bacteroidales bacterium]|nr:LEA type 2 family protein [Bacteroidales bacterium]